MVRLEVDGRSSANKRVLAEVSTTVRVDAATNAAREDEDARPRWCDARRRMSGTRREA